MDWLVVMAVSSSHTKGASRLFQYVAAATTASRMKTNRRDILHYYLTRARAIVYSLAKRTMSETPAADSMDDVIAQYKRDIDVTLLDGNLRLTIDERLVALQRMLQFAEELRRAGSEAQRRP